MNDNNDEQRRFAYGCNTSGDVECPALTANRDPRVSKALREIAGQYDINVSRSRPTDNGVVAEHVARTHWLEAIEELREDDKASRTRETLYEDAVAYGEKIADELGWL
jgi:hypothetical protein